MPDQSEFVVWTILLGVYIPLLLFALFEFTQNRARWAIEVALYIAASAAYIFTLSGYGASFIELLNKDSANVSTWLVYPRGVAISLAVSVGALGVRNWLGIKRRDRFANIVLLSCVGASAASGLFVLFCEPTLCLQCYPNQLHMQLCLSRPTSIALGVGMIGFIATSLVAARAALLGDRGAWLGFACGLLCSPLNLGLALRDLLQLSVSLTFWIIAMSLNIVGMMVLLRAAMRRAQTHAYLAKLVDSRSDLDPITALPMGSAMIKAMEQIYESSLRFKHRPILIVVKVFNTQQIIKQYGEVGLNEVLLATIARIRRVSSSADLFGRYYGACFAILIPSKVSRHYLRSFGLRLAVAARKPVMLRRVAHDEPVQASIGVGICWSDKVFDLSTAMHEAERAADAAALMRSRAAVTLDPEGTPQPVEDGLKHGSSSDPDAIVNH